MSPSWSHRGLQWGEAPAGAWTKPICVSVPIAGDISVRTGRKGWRTFGIQSRQRRQGRAWQGQKAYRHWCHHENRPFSLGQSWRKSQSCLFSYWRDLGWTSTLSPGTMGACSNSNHCWHLLDTYYVPGTIISTLYASFVIFITILWGKGYDHYFMMRKQAQRGAVFLLQVTES